MNGFSISTRLAPADWKAYQAAYTGRVQGRGWRGAALIVGFPAAFGIVVYLLMRFAHNPVEANSLFTGILVGYGALVVVGRLLRYWMRPLPNAAFLGEWHYEFSPLGVRVRRTNGESMTTWAAARDVTGTNDHVFIWTDAVAAFVAPARDLPPGMTGTAAQAELNGLRAQTGSTEYSDKTLSAVVPSEATLISERTPEPARSLGRSMTALLRWATWRPFDGRALDAPAFAIALIGVLAVLLLVGLDRIGVGPNAAFNFFAAQGVACKALGILGLSWLIWRTTDPQISWRGVLFLTAGLATIAVLGLWIVDRTGTRTAHIAASWGLLAILGMYMARGLRAATARPQRRALALALVALVIVRNTFSGYLESGPLWYVPENYASGSYARSMRDAERLLMTQAARIDAAVASMAPRSGDASMFMVGFAGVGEQKVFAGEIALAAKVIGDRYGAQQRTLLLVNDQRDLESQPLATVTGLKLALADIGRRMDRERDILTLVISSHGSEQPAISVSNGALPLNDLTGADLKQALDEAGIRWRVVIISACHAGAFIPFLADERSIVIAAAAADRTSFGCSNDRDLTNFGEAFVRDSLPNSPSLRAAFEKAQTSIAAR